MTQVHGCDTAATVHMTPQANGMVLSDIGKLKAQSIKVGNGNRESNSMHEQLKGK